MRSRTEPEIGDLFDNGLDEDSPSDNGNDSLLDLDLDEQRDLLVHCDS